MLRQQGAEAADAIVDAVATQRRPVGRDVDRDDGDTQPALGLAGKIGQGEVGAGLDDGIDTFGRERLQSVPQIGFGGVADQHLARPLEAVDRADAPAALLEKARDLRVADRLIGRQDADGAHLRKLQQRLGAGGRTERHRDAGALLQALAQTCGAGNAAPEGRYRHRHDQVSGLAAHHPIDRAVKIGADRFDHALELGVVGERKVADMDAADVVGDAGRPHGVGLRLHDGVGRGDDDAELETIAETVGHGACPGPWVWCEPRTMMEPTSQTENPGIPMPSAASNFDNQSLRGVLDMVAADHPDELLRIREPVDTRFDMTAIVYELERAGKSPVVIFEQPSANGMAVVTNVAGNRKLLAACLGVEPGDLPAAFRERCQKYIPCELVREAAWNEVVIEGDEVDLTQLPIPLQFAVDGGPYITAGQISARDPVTGVDTTGFHRLMLKGRNRLGVSLHSRRRMYEFQRRAEEQGKSLPAAITIGTHPLHYMGSMVYAYPPHVRKFEIIGGLFGEPYRLARCGVADLEVPAGAEIIIEGEILAHVHEPEGPFSEFTGYASYRSTQNVFVAHRVRMRKEAMYHSVVSGMSKDHILVSCITREGEILNALKRNLPNARAVHVPHTTCGAFMAFISMKKIAEGEPQMAIMATLGTELYTKFVIVVDDDVDIFDINDVMWALATRMRAEKDIVFIPGAKGAILDPTSDPETFTLTKMGIDATRPAGREFAERLTIPDDQRARARSILAAAGIKL